MARGYRRIGGGHALLRDLHAVYWTLEVNPKTTGTMGFFSSIIGSVVKVAVTPITVASDVVSVATGQKADATKKNLQEAVDDVEEALDDLADGEL